MRATSVPALRVEVAPHLVEVGDVAGHEALEGAAPAEERCGIGLADPRVRRLARRQQHLQGLVDTEHVREALEGVARQRPRVALLPYVVRRSRPQAEQGHGLARAELPRLGDA